MAKGRGGKVGRSQANVPTRERRLLGRVPRLEPGMLARAKAMVAGRSVPPAVRKGKAMSMGAAQEEASKRFGAFATARLGPPIVGSTKRRKILTVIATGPGGFLESRLLGEGWTWEEVFEQAKG